MIKKVLVTIIALLLISNLAMSQPINDVNVALKKTATAANSNSSYPPAKAIDGNRSEASRWAGNIADNWWLVNLGESYLIDAFDLQVYRNDKYSFVVEVSPDSANWEMVVDRSGTPTEGELRYPYTTDKPRIWVNSFAPKLAKYVRVKFPGTGWRNVEEVRVMLSHGYHHGPIWVNGAGQSATKILVEWGQVEAVDQFTIYQSEDRVNFAAIGTAAGAQSSLLVEGLKENTGYYFTVAAEKGGVAVAATDTVMLKTTPGITGFSAERYSTEQIQLTWKNLTDGLAQGIIIKMAPIDSVTLDSVKTVSGLEDTVIIGGLLANSTYQFVATPFDSAGAWTATDRIIATTFPMRMPIEGIGVLVDEDFTDGSFSDPSQWKISPTIGKVGFFAPNNRNFAYGLSRQLVTGEDHWQPITWGLWDDRNANGKVDPGEYLPRLVNKTEDVIIYKFRHFSDAAQGSPEYFKLQGTITGPKLALEIGGCHNNNDGTWGGRQVKARVNNKSIWGSGNEWIFPDSYNHANLPAAHNDSTLGLDFENLFVFRAIPTRNITNVEHFGHNMYGDHISLSDLNADSTANEALIEKCDFILQRPGLAGAIIRPGISPQDVQVGFKHVSIGITKCTDANLDYVTDVEDFFIMASNWGPLDTLLVPTGNPRDPFKKVLLYKTLLHGDFNNNDVVEATDFDVLKKHWGKGKKQETIQYHYEAPKARPSDHRLVAEVNTKNGLVRLIGTDQLTVVGYKLYSPAGGFRYGPRANLLKGLKTVSATEISECDINPKTFTAPTPRDASEKRIHELGKIYNYDVNPKDLVLVWQDALGGKTMIGGVTYIDTDFDGMFTSVSDSVRPDTTNALVFAYYQFEVGRRNLYWNKSGGRDIGQQFKVPGVTVLDKITIAIKPVWWVPGTLETSQAAQGDGAFIEIVKSATKDAASVVEKVARYYGNFPTTLDTLKHRFITFDLPGDGISLQPLGGDSTWGFIVGFASPKEGREVWLSMVEPQSNPNQLYPDYPHGDKIDFSWKQARDVDGSYKYNPWGWQWAHQLTFWLEASKIGGTAVEDLAENQLPTRFELAQNYPNPFNPTTHITFSLPTRAQVSLAIYDLTGRLVKEIVDDQYDVGIHHVVWDATDSWGHGVASGIYYYRLKTDQFTETKKMLFLK